MVTLIADSHVDREREYHNKRFTEETRLHQGKYYAAIKHGAERFDARLNGLLRGADVLEYGCGDNSKTFDFADRCRTAVGIDISDVAVQHANTRAAHEGLTNLSFEAMNAEEMTFADARFDLVYGRGIIHHLDLRKSFSSIARVLRPTGTALFWEPLGHNVLINGYRKSTPDARTPDEHPLLKHDFDLAKEYFDEVKLSFYGLTTLATVPVRDTWLGDALLQVTAAIDSALFLVPGLKWQAWHCMMELRSPKRA
jgi:SAM-dependent methyltransferase